MLERHRLAAQRSAKARALFEQAMDWETTITNREQLTKDAFTEAGKARLLVEDCLQDQSTWGLVSQPYCRHKKCHKTISNLMFV